jgi:hypothetical protein
MKAIGTRDPWTLFQLWVRTVILFIRSHWWKYPLGIRIRVNRICDVPT